MALEAKPRPARRYRQDSDLLVDEVDGFRVDDQSHTHKFEFMWNPNEWGMNVDGKLLPTVIHAPKKRGVNGFGYFKRWEEVRVQYERLGWRRLDKAQVAKFLRDPNDPEDVGGYTAEYTNQRGQTVYRTIFQAEWKDASGTSHWSHDGEAWAEFIEACIELGLIERPKPEVVRGLLESAKRYLDRLRKPATDDPVQIQRWQEKVERGARNIQLLEEHLRQSREVHGVNAAPVRTIDLAERIRAAKEHQQEVTVKAIEKRKRRTKAAKEDAE